MFLTRLATVFMLRRNGLEFLLQFRDAVANLTPVEFERGFSSTPTLLAFLTPRRLTQTGGHVFQSRDLDLQPRLATLRVAMKDFHDDVGSVEHLCSRGPLEIARLPWGDLVIHDNEARVLTVAASSRTETPRI